MINFITNLFRKKKVLSIDEKVSNVLSVFSTTIKLLSNVKEEAKIKIAANSSFITKLQNENTNLTQLVVKMDCITNNIQKLINE